MDRPAKFMETKAPIDIDIRVYAKEEIVEMARDKSRIIREIDEYGILLSGDKTIIEQIKQAKN